jgi:16S rRNA (guanine527-N7)-methyltransferase
MKHLLHTYFPDLSPEQLGRYEHLAALVRILNEQVNVISRKDMDFFEVHHLLHSLTIAHYFPFSSGTRIMDAGTGGGFPGIPLAIFFPEVEFVLVDSIAKKIKVVDELRKELGLKNVSALCSRTESVADTFDFITGRAVTALPGFFNLVRKKILSAGRNGFSNGIIYLKGGDFSDELRQINAVSTVYNLSEVFSESFFETKKLVHIHTK